MPRKGSRSKASDKTSKNRAARRQVAIMFHVKDEEVTEEMWAEYSQKKEQERAAEQLEEPSEVDPALAALAQASKKKPMTTLLSKAESDAMGLSFDDRERRPAMEAGECQDGVSRRTAAPSTEVGTEPISAQSAASTVLKNTNTASSAAVVNKAAIPAALESVVVVKDASQIQRRHSYPVVQTPTVDNTTTTATTFDTITTLRAMQEEQVTALRMQLEELRKDNRKQEAELAQLSTEHSIKLASIKNAQEKERENAYNSEMRMQEKVDKANSELAKKITEIEAYKNEITEHLATIKTAAATDNTNAATIEDLTTTIEAYKTDLAAVTEQSDLRARELTSSKHRVAVLEQKIKATEAADQSLQATIDWQGHQITSLQSKLQELESAREQKEEAEERFTSLIHGINNLTTGDDNNTSLSDVMDLVEGAEQEELQVVVDQLLELKHNADAHLAAAALAQSKEMVDAETQTVEASEKKATATSLSFSDVVAVEIQPSIEDLTGEEPTIAMSDIMVVADVPASAVSPDVEKTAVTGNNLSLWRLILAALVLLMTWAMVQFANGYTTTASELFALPDVVAGFTWVSSLVARQGQPIVEAFEDWLDLDRTLYG